MKPVSLVIRCGVQLAYNISTALIPVRKVHRTTAFFVSAWGSKKKHRKVKLHFTFDRMTDPKIEEILAPLRASVKEQVSFTSSDHTLLNLNNESTCILDLWFPQRLQ
jgi:hypothetical protein